MNRTPEIFFICPGLGHISRGYETFTRQCFDALKNETPFHLRLFKGAGPNGYNETRIPIVDRTKLHARLTGRLFGRTGYEVEQLSFALGLIPHLRRVQPDVVYFSDRELGTILWYWRKMSGQSFRLVFSNGGPAPPPFPRWDHVHQVSPEYYQDALRAGTPAARQTLIPYGYETSRQPRVLSSEEKIALRRNLGLPAQRTIVMSVGMLSRAHKRMDYIVQEIRRLPEPRPYLLMLGQNMGSETAQLIAMAYEALGPENFRIATVPSERIADYYWSSDVFMLASLTEGFGRVFLEAMAAGLPCISHDHPTSRYVLGSSGFLVDLRHPGALATMIPEATKRGADPEARIERQRDVYERFSWDRLAPDYSAMLLRIARKADSSDPLNQVREGPTSSHPASNLQSCATSGEKT